MPTPYFVASPRGIPGHPCYQPTHEDTEPPVHNHFCRFLVHLDSHHHLADTHHRLHHVDRRQICHRGFVQRCHQEYLETDPGRQHRATYHTEPGRSGHPVPGHPSYC